MSELQTPIPRSYLRATVWSNAVFLIPLGFALVARLPAYAALLSVATLFSVLHHLLGRKIFYYIDVALAFCVIAANFYLCILSGFWNVPVGLAFVSVAISFYFFFKEEHDHYEFNHTLWHIWCGIISMWCIVAYVLHA